MNPMTLPVKFMHIDIYIYVGMYLFNVNFLTMYLNPRVFSETFVWVSCTDLDFSMIVL